MPTQPLTLKLLSMHICFTIDVGELKDSVLLDWLNPAHLDSTDDNSPISSLPSQALLPAQKTMPFQPNIPQVHAPEGEFVVPNVFHDSFMYMLWATGGGMWCSGL